MLYENLTHDKTKETTYYEYYGRLYGRRTPDSFCEFDYLEKLMQLKSLSLFEIDNIGFFYLPSFWKILLQQLEELKVFRMYNLKALPFEYLTNLKRLSVPNEEFENIAEIEKLEQLEELEIHEINFDILKLKKLKKLKIRWINLETLVILKQMPHLRSLDLTEATQGRTQESIKALSKAIGELTQLEELNLTGCYSFNLSCLRKLKNLKSLNISSLYETKLKPVTALANNLEKLNISCNDFMDLHLLSQFKKLKWLKAKYASDEKISKLDLKFLRSLKQLEYFYVGAFRDAVMANFNAIGSCKNLKQLYCVGSLSCSAIKNIKALRHCKGLECLTLDNNKIVSIKPLKNLKCLRELSLVYCGIHSIEALRNKPELTLLDISDNFITDISPLEKSKKLRNLIVSPQEDDVKISDISVLSDKVGLEELEIQDNTIRNLSPLKDLTNLTKLDIGGNPFEFSELSCLKKLQKLECLYLGDCNVKDLSVIQHLTKLEELELVDNPIEDYSPLLHLRKLYYLELGENDMKDYSMFNKKNFPDLDLDFIEE